MGKPGQSRQAKFGEKGKSKNKKFFLVMPLSLTLSDTFYPSQSAKIYSEVS
jgi:hypothetical protein